MNSRLDTIQVGVLIAKFDTFKNEELDKVNAVVEMYNTLLEDVEGLALPHIDFMQANILTG